MTANSVESLFGEYEELQAHLRRLIRTPEDLHKPEVVILSTRLDQVVLALQRIWYATDPTTGTSMAPAPDDRNGAER